MNDIWKKLWDDFNTRAEKLALRQTPDNAVDKTILWQLKGHKQFVGKKIPVQGLHLPELYSGSPWQHRKKWVAIVTVNPSIDPTEIFPTRTHLTTHGIASVVSFFENRFEPRRIDSPITHGRSGANSKWKNPKKPQAYRQPTWAAIDAAVRTCLPLHGRKNEKAPLGHVAAIVDIVPWKFAHWAKVPYEIQMELLKLGEHFLNATLAKHPPAVIIAAGKSVRQIMHTMHQKGVPVYQTKTRQTGTMNIGGREVPWFGVVAPTAHGNRFRDDMRSIRLQIRAAIT
jgi:hypothetical protein